MPMTGNFDANQVAPRQLGENHPVGKFPFHITNTELAETKDKTGGMFVVTFNTPSGNAVMRYNIWNQSEKAKEIAHGQLSALCHATGIFKLDWANDGAALARRAWHDRSRISERPRADARKSCWWLYRSQESVRHKR